MMGGGGGGMCKIHTCIHMRGFMQYLKLYRGPYEYRIQGLGSCSLKGDGKGLGLVT